MKICFLDPTFLDYDIHSPLTQGMGGSQSALCYLAGALAKRGHSITVVNGIQRPGVYEGVEFLEWQQESVGGVFNRSDVLIVQSTAIGQMLQGSQIGVRVPMVLWTGHDADQPATSHLVRQEERDSWAGFAFVSNWQREVFRNTFALRSERCTVKYNGISPAFIEAAIEPPWFETGKPPVLAYTSTPFRGLDVLLDAFPLIRRDWPEAGLRIYSSMSIYGKKIQQSPDPYEGLYAKAASIPGVAYVGPVGQAQLAREMAGMAALAYPNIFPETFCIAAAEAAAVGAALFLTRLGALPEINAGLGSFIDSPTDREKLVRDFAALVSRELKIMTVNPGLAAAQRATRITNYRLRFAWPRIAVEWESWLDSLVGQTTTLRAAS